LFAAVSGDNNALHINQEFAQTTQFKGRIAHGMLSASVISAAIAGRLPGPGTIYMGQNLRFMAPVRAGDTVHATVVVKELIPEKCRAVDHGVHCRRRDRDRRGCIGNNHVARSPEDLSLPADRAKKRLLDPRPETSLPKRCLRSKWAPRCRGYWSDDPPPSDAF
jgi:hypothetical protein